ncbi:conserved hypothetical protein [Tenacibaculum halocynthiae]
MIINSFALFVNYFGLSPEFEVNGGKKDTYTDNMTYRVGENSFFLFSDSAKKSMVKDANDIGVRLYKTRYKKHFWPFTKFNDETTKVVKDYDGNWNYNKKGHTFYYNGKRFRGIFADFDHTEFFVYTLLIFGIVLIRKIW